MEHSMTLVIFTFLSQLAIGGFVTLFLLDAYKEKLSKRATFHSLLALLAISAVAVVVSIFHLGHPLAAYRAILNFGESWLAREIVFFPTFILFVILYTFFAKTAKAKKATGWGATVLGAVTIISTAMIYIIPAVPAWNSGLTMIGFFVTAILLGPVFIQLLLAVLEKKVVDLSKYTVLAAVAAILINIINLSILNGGFPEAVESASIMIASPLFWTKIVGLVVGVAIAGLSLKNKRIYSPASIS